MHERGVHTGSIENASNKISMFLGSVQPVSWEILSGIFIRYACGLPASVRFHGKSSQFCLADWEFQNLVTLQGPIARCSGDPGWNSTDIRGVLELFRDPSGEA